jgi:hypothetical protein
MLVATPRHLPAAELHLGTTRFYALAGEPVAVPLHLDWDEESPGDQVPAPGLLSMGVRLVFDPANVAVASPHDIVVPKEINSDGAGGPPSKEVGAGYAAVQDVVMLEATNGYTAPLMATFRVRSDVPGTYGLTPAMRFAPDNGGLANFVDYQGVLLDDRITNFAGATLSVLVQPAISSVARAGDQDVVLAVTDTNAVERSIVAEGNSSLTPNAGWETVAGAVLTTNSSGVHELRLPTHGARLRCYRVNAMVPSRGDPPGR